MKAKKSVLYSILTIVLISSCCKDPKSGECADGKQWILGGCVDETKELYIFSGYPDFYCFNDSLALGYDVQRGGLNWSYYLNTQYTKNKGVGNNWLMGTFSSSDSGWGKFSARCSESPDSGIKYYTFLYIEDHDKITSETREIRGRLELGDRYPLPEPVGDGTYTVLDSSYVILKRVN